MNLTDVLEAIESMAGDDFCADLEMRCAFGKESQFVRTVERKFAEIYRLAHSFNKRHSCYCVHGEWRRELKKYSRQQEGEVGHGTTPRALSSGKKSSVPKEGGSK